MRSIRIARLFGVRMLERRAPLTSLTPNRGAVPHCECGTRLWTNTAVLRGFCATCALKIEREAAAERAAKLAEIDQQLKDVA